MGRGEKYPFTGRERKPLPAISVRCFVVVTGLAWGGGPHEKVANDLLPGLKH